MRSDTPPAAVTPAETVVVHEHRIYCDGAGGALGHPRVFLEMGQAHEVDCPYCDRKFVLEGHVHAEDEHTAPASYEGAGGH